MSETWEYGFYDSQQPGVIYWYTFGGLVGFDTADSARRTASKSVTGTAMIVRRHPGSDEWEHVYDEARKSDEAATVQILVADDAVTREEPANDIEKLIERVRAVIETAVTDAYTAASQMNVTASDDAATARDVSEAEAVRDLVVAALEAVEKAHTPTDDDREAQGWRQAALYAEDAESQDDFMTGWRTADRLRPTEVPERAAPRKPFTVPVAGTYEMGPSGWRLLKPAEVPEASADDVSAEHQRHADARRAETMTLISHAEPQGEPSDAQVEIAWRTYEGISPKTFVMGPAIGKARERMRAALRAAGGVR